MVEHNDKKGGFQSRLFCAKLALRIGKHHICSRMAITSSHNWWNTLKVKMPYPFLRKSCRCSSCTPATAAPPLSRVPAGMIMGLNPSREA